MASTKEESRRRVSPWWGPIQRQRYPCHEKPNLNHINNIRIRALHLQHTNSLVVLALWTQDYGCPAYSNGKASGVWYAAIVTVFERTSEIQSKTKTRTEGLPSAGHDDMTFENRDATSGSSIKNIRDTDSIGMGTTRSVVRMLRFARLN